MKKSKTIEINGQEVTINKMKVGQFASLMLAFEDLPSVVTDIMKNMQGKESFTEVDLLAKLPHVIAHATDDVIQLVSVASGFTTEEINEFDFEELIDVVTAVVEINNLKVIVDKVKNLTQVFQKQA